MFSKEWIKLLWKQKGVWVLLFFLFVKVSYTIVRGNETTAFIEENKVAYARLHHQYDGKLTNTKRQEIDDDYESIMKAEGHLYQLQDLFKEKKIDRKTFITESKKYFKLLTQQGIFNLFYSEVIRVEEDRKQRYLLDGRGWSQLLTDNTPDILLLICLIFVLVPLFCGEYEAEMNLLLLTSSNGRNKVFVYKWLVGILLSCLIYFLFQGIEVVYLLNAAGLEHYDYPLQSLSFFETSPYQISVGKALAFILLSRICGVLLLLGIVILCSVLFRKKIYVLFSAMVVIFLPLLFSTRSQWLANLSLPTSFMQGSIYLQGNIQRAENLERDAVLLTDFYHIPFARSVLIFTFGLFILCCLFLLSLKVYHQSSWRKITRQGRKMKVGLLLFMVPVLTSCTKVHTVQDEAVIYYSHTQDRLENDTYILAPSEDTYTLQYQNKKTGEKGNVNRHVFKDGQESTNYFLTGKQAYYMVTNESEMFRVICVDLETFSEYVVYNCIKNTDNFLIPDEIQSRFKDQDVPINNALEGFFLTSKYLYVVKEKSVQRINLKSRQSKIILKERKKGTPMIHQKAKIYYMDLQNRIGYYDEETEENKIFDIYSENIYLKGGRVMYQDIFDNDKEKVLILNN